MVEEDQGGTPNRYTTARRLMFTEVERRELLRGDGGRMRLHRRDRLSTTR